MTSLIATLDAAFSRTTDPDELVLVVHDPIYDFVKCCDIDEKIYEAIRERELAYYNYRSQRWNSTHRADTTPVRSMATNTERDSWIRFQRYGQHLFGVWAIIGYEHRLRPDLEFPVYEPDYKTRRGL